MSKSITGLRIKDGVLQVSYDNGCHYEDIGQVGGADGKDGTNGSVCTIDPVTKHWLIDGVDTGVLAEGVDGINGDDGIDGMDGIDGIPYSIIAAPGENIAVVGTPSVSTSSDSVTKTTTFTFNYLKGEKGNDGETPEITTEAITDADKTVIGYHLKINGTTICDIYNGLDAPVYTSINPIYIDNTTNAISLRTGEGLMVSNDNLTLTPALASAIGGIKLGYIEGGRDYAVQSDVNNRAFVHVPWNNTTYVAGNGISITAGATISTDDILTEYDYTDSHPSLTLTCASSKHNIINLGSSSEGSTFNIYIDTTTTTNGYMPKEVICRIVAPHTLHTLNISKVSGDSGTVEAYVSIASAGATPIELVFTFWKAGLVTYNGGESI